MVQEIVERNFHGGDHGLLVLTELAQAFAHGFDGTEITGTLLFEELPQRLVDTR